MSEPERARLESLARYNILDSAPEPEYDDIVQRAAELCDCPIATITLVDWRRQWFKASLGLDVPETERGIALCDHTIRGTGLLVIPDTLLDERFIDNPVVAAPDGIRFYAGAPLVSSDNQVLGTLCVMDYRPRALSDAQVNYLRLLADQVMMHLELRRQNLRLRETVEEQERAQRLTGIAGRLARVGAWSVDVTSREVTMSPEILALHGLGSATRLTLDDCLNFYGPEDKPKIQALFSACVNEGVAYDEELQVLNTSGQSFWVRALGEPVFNQDGRVIRVDGAFQDISEQRLAAGALREEKVRFEAAARATADAIWDWNTATDRLWWSEGMQTLFGYSAADLEHDSRSWTTRIYPDDKRRVLTDIERVIYSQQQKWEAEYRFMRKDGSVAYVSDRGYVIRDENGDALRMVGGMSDVTERRQFLANLARQAALLDQSSDAIMVLDLERRITYWNRAAEAIYGWRQDQALGRRIDEVLGEDPSLLEAAARSLLDNGQWAGSLSGRNADGERVISEARWSLVGDDHGEPEAVLAINTDITERLALEEQLQQSQRLEAVGQLTGGVAHDFNNLLTVILGNSELLEEQLEDTPLLRDSARLIRGAAERAAELTRRLLAFARRQPLSPEIVDVNDLINGLTPLLRPSLHEQVTFDIVSCASPWPAFIDPGQLESAILNLCINARDAMSGNGCIVLETANVTLDSDYAKRHSEVVAGDYIQVVVSDTGEGIPAAALKRVFEPFFTTKPKGKGTGLGLSMVYGFVKQSRGHIKIYSEPGEGTTVKLYLPRADREDERPAAPPVSPVRFSNRAETVLLVEDDDAVRDQAARQLQDLGYRVISASDGEAALAMLQEQDVDLLFTDVIMPGGPNGPELARLARQRRPGLPVLYTSGYTENAIVHQGRLDPGVHLLEKPYHRDELARKVRDALNEVPR
ncbi:MAG TPA: PAS domain-containing protein [Alcanivorax sp.]|nr:PAS domain-containing protein [Alcanivorax sp.]